MRVGEKVLRRCVVVVDDVNSKAGQLREARLQLWGPNRDVDISTNGFSHANTLLPTARSELGA